MTKKILNIPYCLVGLYVFFETLVRLYQEGTFGNETHIYFLVMIGPQIGFLKLASALCLTIGQVLDLFNKKFCIWFSRISFLLTIMTLIAIYLIYEMWYIWGYLTDFLVFSLIIIFYVPIISGKLLFRKLKQTNAATTA